MKYDPKTDEHYVEIPLLRGYAQGLLELKPETACLACQYEDEAGWNHGGHFRGAVWSTLIRQPVTDWTRRMGW
jgi:hypothetical protein